VFLLFAVSGCRFSLPFLLPLLVAVLQSQTTTGIMLLDRMAGIKNLMAHPASGPAADRSEFELAAFSNLLQ
jgi:hypothetical protein